MCTGAMLCVSMGPNIWLTMAHPNQAMACDIPHSSCKPVTGPSPKYCLDIKQIGSNIDTHYIIITYINESSHWPALSFWWDSPIFCKDIRHHPLALATTQNLVLKDEHRVAVTSVSPQDPGSARRRRLLAAVRMTAVGTLTGPFEEVGWITVGCKEHIIRYPLGPRRTMGKGPGKGT